MTIQKKDLKNPIAEGAEGIIFEWENNTLLKIFKDTSDKQEKQAKAELLIHKNLPDNVIRPIDLVYDGKKNFLGYQMRRVEGEEIRRLGNKKFVISNNITKKDILSLLIQIRDTLQILHREGVFIGDLNDQNVLFDQNFKVYFIDVDSWSVDSYRCTVIMELFKDPLLVRNFFDEKTDSYAFSILAFKSLTRLHPFGGVLDPDISMMERMKKGISVIDNPNVIIPKNIDSWNFFSPEVKDLLKEIFTNQKRILMEKPLSDFHNNLFQCSQHEDYYYADFDQCPVCSQGAAIVQKPAEKTAPKGTGIPFRLLFSHPEIKILFNENCWLSEREEVNFRTIGLKLPFESATFYESLKNSALIVKKEKLMVQNQKTSYEFEKLLNSPALAREESVYYISRNCSLTALKIREEGNSEKTLEKVSLNCLFNVYDEKNYFILNFSENKKIASLSGINLEISLKGKIIQYGIHFDPVENQWLFTAENDSGVFKTFVFGKSKILYENEKKKYIAPLKNLCFYGNVIFEPGEKVISGFNFQKNASKDFEAEPVSEETELIRRGSKFIAVNQREIYEIG
ncbi:MAG TPA: hypothetical protein DHW82_13995 [Spirochaetia bacterium]|nr:MAG: hypothetical protein A2Y41_09955 [Spirochaetes bacterium GWB1_36_13]HCL58101.1 hypothetical protein [Spirochaetia bacterium]